MEISSNSNFEVKQQPRQNAETAGTLAQNKKEPELFRRLEDVETAGSLANAQAAETIGTIAAAGAAETGGVVASAAGGGAVSAASGASSSGGGFSSMA